MPQSIWEQRQKVHPPPQYVTDLTDTWAYIGATVFSRNGAAWVFSPVKNRKGNGWTLLNAAYGPVDYDVDAEWNEATITITPPGRTDITIYRIRIDKKTGPDTYVSVIDTTIPSTQTMYRTPAGKITELTDYRSNVQAEYYLGPPDESTKPDPTPEWSPDSLDYWQTPKNPIPTPPLNLRSPNRTNAWIDLAWNASANGTATKYLVYSKVGNTGSPVLRKTVTGLSVRVTGLKEDTKYQWWVRGQNASGATGQPSNILRWATGHDAIVKTGAVGSEPLNPVQWGSWRRDIGWLDWHTYPGRPSNHQWIYQGYWPGPRNYGPTHPNTSQYEQNGRYKGIITYDAAGFRARLNARYGYDIGSGFSSNAVTVTGASIRRPYRQREPGNSAYQWMQWWVAWATPYNGEPVLRAPHRNGGSNDADHVDAHHTFRAGMYHDWLRIPRYFAHSIIQGWIWNTATPVNAIGLYRDDNEHNGYGTAGYARFSGHGMTDSYPGYTQYYSDWTIYLDCNWSIRTRSYLAPYQWT